MALGPTTIHVLMTATLLAWGGGVLLPASVNGIRAVCGNDVSVPVCATPVPRDVVFILDTSNSLNPTDFYNNTLNYIQSLYCAFSSAPGSQAGVVTFSQQITTRISLGPWTTTEWFSQLETIRSDPTVCCSCCTPTAEAFALAYQMFAASGKNAIQIAYIVTDGYPYQARYTIHINKRKTVTLTNAPKKNRTRLVNGDFPK